MPMLSREKEGEGKRRLCSMLRRPLCVVLRLRVLLVLLVLAFDSALGGLEPEPLVTGDSRSLTSPKGVLKSSAIQRIFSDFTCSFCDMRPTLSPARFM